MKDMTVAVIIPALNEAETIGDLIVAVQEQAVDHIIVVDNGSTDGTGEVANNAGAIVVSEPRRGYGFACMAGSLEGVRLSADILVYMDADFSSLPTELERLLQPLRDNQADLVLGSRTLGHIEKGAMPPHQRFGNWLSSRLMRFLYKVDVTDLGPYRAIRTTLFTSLDMQEMTFGWPTEMMVKTAREKRPILEVPVSWLTRRAGKSKVSGTIRGSILAGYYILGVTVRYAVK